MRNRVTIFLAATLLAVIPGWSAPADPSATARGTLRGTVTDPSGAAIPAASVVVSGVNFTRSVATDESGRYSVAGLPPGHYSVQFHSTGFSPQEKSGLVLAAGYETEAGAQLAIKASRQAITVR